MEEFMRDNLIKTGKKDWDVRSLITVAYMRDIFKMVNHMEKVNSCGKMGKFMMVNGITASNKDKVIEK